MGKKQTIDIVERQKNYGKDHCWQYDIRLNNLSKDIAESGMSKERIAGLKVSDFVFRPLVSKEERQEATAFIERHEWLGNLSQYTTHWFGAFIHDPDQGLVGKDILAGVILMNMPNAFSKMMGEDTRKIERLVSRGACISWSPKNLASSFLMWSIEWMAKNTQYRLFTAYSDPTAKEIGTIYQACNFYYLGQDSGTTVRCINPYTGRIVSDRFFRVRSAYKKYAKALGIKWEKNWNNDQRMLWENVPPEVESALREMSKRKYAEAVKVEFPSKHKYAYVLGANKTETRQLRRKFETMNKVLPYPKERGK